MFKHHSTVLLSAAIVAATSSTSSVFAENEVRVWGDFGLCGSLDANEYTYKVAAGENHVAVVTHAGRVLSWGSDSSGQCNVPADLPHVKEVAVGQAHTLALGSDGSIRGWGNDGSGRATPPNLGSKRAIAIAASRTASFAIVADGNDQQGSVIAWGNSGTGQLTLLPNAVQALDNAVKIVAGDEFAAVLDSNGNVTAWGVNDANLTRSASAGRAITKLVAGSTHLAALYDDGTVDSWGGALGNDNTIDNVPQIDDVAIDIVAGKYWTMALVVTDYQETETVMWGYVPQAIAAVPDEAEVLAILLAAGPEYVYAMDAWDVEMLSWGTKSARGLESTPRSFDGATQVSVGYEHVLAVRADGGVTAWGSNLQGQCDVPEDLSDVTHQAFRPTVKIAAGRFSSMALLENGDVRIWGQPDASNGNAAQEWETRLNTLGSPVKEIYADWFRAAAISENSQGIHFGIQSWANETVPQLSSLDTIALGLTHSLILDMNGVISGWGTNVNKEIIPAPSLLGADVIDIAAGQSWSAALVGNADASKSVVSWNASGAEGYLNPPTNSMLDLVEIDGGTHHGIARSSDGFVLAWGNGTTNNQSLTIPADIEGVLQVEAKGYVSAALLNNSDNDGDGIFDPFDDDDDNDGVSDVDEMAAGTDPFNPDTDGDGYSDLEDQYPLLPCAAFHEDPLDNCDEYIGDHSDQADQDPPGDDDDDNSLGGDDSPADGDSGDNAGEQGEGDDDQWPAELVDWDDEGTGHWMVPLDYDPELALELAQEGDYIYFDAGVYAIEPIDVRYKHLNLIGAVDLETGGPATIIELHSEQAAIRFECADEQSIIIWARIKNMRFEGNGTESARAVELINCNTNIENCHFTDIVSALEGPALFVEGRFALVEDSLFLRNRSQQRGGAIYLDYANGLFWRSTLRDNVSEIYGGAIFSTIGFQMRHCTVSNNVAFRGGGVFGGFDPMYTKFCGNQPNHVEGGLGHMHSMWEDHNQVSRCCVESDGAAGSCAADFNADGIVNGNDLARVLSSWGDPDYAPCALDLNSDGVVDGADLAALLGAWGQCGG